MRRYSLCGRMFARCRIGVHLTTLCDKHHERNGWMRRKLKRERAYTLGGIYRTFGKEHLPRHICLPVCDCVIARDGQTARRMSREAAPQPMQMHTTSEISSTALSTTRNDICWLSPLLLCTADSCTSTPDCTQPELQIQQNMLLKLQTAKPVAGRE